jgi:hypothetical protein
LPGGWRSLWLVAALFSETDSALGLGTARVLMTTSFKASQGVLCNAIVADPNNSTPVSMTSLPAIRRTTQQGD